MTPSAEDLLERLRGLGVTIAAEGGKLVLDAPKNTVTPELREEIANNKAAIIKLLQSQRYAGPPRHPDTGLELSRAQKRLWFLDQLYPGSAVYNLAISLRLRGDLDRAALERSLAEIYSRHRVLRSNFAAEDGTPRAHLRPASDWGLHFEDLTGTPPLEREGICRSRLREEAERPLHLASDCLFAGYLWRLGDREHVLCVRMHHIVSDGWSLGILSQELSALYTAFAAGKPCPLPSLLTEYADYVDWERASELESDQHLAFWRRKLGGELPVIQLPSDKIRSAAATHRGLRSNLFLPPQLAEQLRKLSRERKATLFMTLLAGFKAVLARQTRLDDIITGTATSYRSREEFNPLMGFFVNNLTLRTSLSGDPSCAELLDRVRETCTEAYAHQSVPFDRVVEAIQPRRGVNYSPLFQVMFVLQNVPLPELKMGPLEVSIEPTGSQAAHYDLTVEIWPSGGGYRCEFEYNTELIDSHHVERFKQQYIGVLSAMTERPDRKVSELPMLGAADRALLAEWSAAETAYPRAGVHKIFEWQAAQSPKATAIVFGREEITYSELNRRANALAARLKELGAIPGMPVGVYMERNPRLIATFLAILKCGGAYLPLDPAYPAERISFMLQDSGVRIGIRDMPSPVGDSASAIAWIDLRDLDEAEAPSQEFSSEDVSPDSLAYIMYTSGSTGKPKGVEIPHRGIARLIFNSGFARFGPDEVFLHLSPQCFDASTLEIWGPLLHGGKCVLYPGRTPSPGDIRHEVERNKVTTLWLTASLFNSLVDRMIEAFAGVTQIIAGGEALSLPHVRRALERLPHAQLINGYGPTENTTFTCCYPIPRDLDPRIPSVPIGRPIGNTRVYILDAKMGQTPVGVPGELYIGGDGLALGYRNRPELTEQCFVPNPFSTDPASRLYRSGDLVRFREDGNIEFLGRLDHQVKLRGHRIEPGEVESAMLEFTGAVAAFVTVETIKAGDDRLVAYYVPAPGTPQDPKALRAILGSKLPAYMIPNLFVRLESMPLTANGKVDRKALSAIPLIEAATPLPLSGPRDEYEARLGAIMARLLQVPEVKPEDDFFSLGGHSLLGMQLISAIEAEFHKKLPPAILFEASSVEALATVLRENQPARKRCLVGFHTSGERPPLFLIHGLDGEVLFYWYILRHLPEELPVYGLRCSMLDDETVTSITVEEMAERYAAEIRSVQRRGPYRVCGFSFGGVMAFELARRFAAEGEEVEFLGIMDAAAYALKIDWTVRERLGQISRRIGYRVSILRQEGARSLASYLRNRTAIVRQMISGRTKKEVHKAVANWIAPERRNAAMILQRAVFDYAPAPYSGKAVLFRSRDRRDTGDLDPLNGWGKLVPGGIDVHEFNGDHVTFIKEPNAREVAGRLNELLTALDAKAGPETIGVGPGVK